MEVLVGRSERSDLRVSALRYKLAQAQHLVYIGAPTFQGETGGGVGWYSPTLPTFSFNICANSSALVGN